MIIAFPGHELRQKAIAFSTHHHGGQQRDTGAPYITHPLAAAAIIEQTMGPHSVHEQVIAILHDTIEMCDGVDHKMIKRVFGSRIANDVRSLSRAADLTADQRRNWLWKTGRSKSACIAMAADKIDNLRTIPANWPAERVRGYLMKVRENAHYLETRVPPALLGLIEGAYNDVAARVHEPRFEPHMRAGGWRPGLRTRGGVNYAPEMAVA